MRSRKGNMSSQQRYVKMQNHRRYLVIFLRIFIFILFLALWEWASRMQVINSFIFSSPSKITVCFLRMAKDHTIFRHIGVTLIETLISFVIALLIGLIISLLLWCASRAASVAEPYLVVLNSLPKSALAPLLIVWLGTGTRTIIVTGVSMAVFGTILNLYTGFREVDEEQIKLIYTLGGGKRDVLVKVIVPGTRPLLVSVMKVNIGLSLVGVVIGEFLAADEGLGYLIIYGSQVFQLNLVIMSIFILCVIAVILYQGIAIIEKALNTQTHTGKGDL